MNGAPGEPDQRSRAQLGHQLADGDRHELDLRGIERHQRIEIRHRPHRLLDHRPDPGNDVDAEAQGDERDHDVAEQDRRINPMTADGLQRDLGDQLRRAAGLEHGLIYP